MSTNQLLRKDLNRMKKMITTLEEIKSISSQLIRQCKCCDNNSNNNHNSKQLTKLNKLKSNYDKLKNDSNVTQLTCHTTTKTYNIMPKSGLKQIKNNNKTSRVVSFVTKRGRKSKQKQKELLFSDINTENVSLVDNKSEVIETLGKSTTVTMTVTCHWPGCDAVFRDHHDLKEHMWRHTGEKEFVCEWPGCDKRFPIKRNLIRHQIIHEEVKQHSCDWPGCEFKCWYAQGLRVHRLRHNDERPFKCSWPHCDCQFRQSHHLKAHMLKHTGEKPYACDWPECTHRFQSRQAMKFHIERAHKSQQQLYYSCVK